MGMRVHTTRAAAINIGVLRNYELAGTYPDLDFDDDGDALVLEDSPNGEAFVLLGDVDEWVDLATRILTYTRNYRQGR